MNGEEPLKVVFQLQANGVYRTDIPKGWPSGSFNVYDFQGAVDEALEGLGYAYMDAVNHVFVQFDEDAPGKKDVFAQRLSQSLCQKVGGVVECKA